MKLLNKSLSVIFYIGIRMVLYFESADIPGFSHSLHSFLSPPVNALIIKFPV